MSNSNVLISIIILTIINLAALVGLARYISSKVVREHKPAPSAPQVRLAKDVINRLESQTEAAYVRSVQQASQQFSQDIDKTSQSLNDLIVRLTTSVVEEELMEYRKGLAAARAAALHSLSSMERTVEKQQQVLQVDMRTAVSQRQTELLERLDKKIATVTANYIVEALGQAVDLGAQREYLFATLERHKTLLKKEIVGE